MRRLSGLLTVAVLVGLFAVPETASAYATSCGTFTVSAYNTSCTYQATGPGMYKAATYGGYRILISRAGGPFYTVKDVIQGSCAVPNPNSVAVGSIASIAGDLVKLEIKAGCLQENTPMGPVPATPLRPQVGWISGGDMTSDGGGGGGGELPPVPDPTKAGNAANSCVAKDTTGLVTTGAMSCTYQSGYAIGEVIQMTPNHITITYVADDGSVVTVYSQNTLTPPSRATFNQPVGKTMTVTVGPDVAGGPVAGALGIVVAGDGF
jgi:hypothetical protein